MSWLEIAAIVVLLIGVGAGGFLVAQRPSFWLGMGSTLLKAAFPHILKYVSTRMTPEQEKAYQDCLKRGGEWDSFKKRCRER